ncbi:hypothetical protein FJU08_01370 [Martelella alba]|uniref:Uncharacterized protein n=1 Tax=Martelella alba TaxID=2590451 RepID=A0A506UIW2_9HYPH|nr:hypothetical protein [Martelella alba]TPW33242.1 hypothetical protein FJU08_01370 [Martelella alba]
METAIAAIGSLFTGGGAGAAAAGAASASAATSAASGLASAAALKTGFGILSGVSALGQIGLGLSQASTFRAQANEADLQAGQEQVAAQQRQNQIRREMAAIFGDTKGKYAAAGVDLTGGIAQDQAQKNAQAAVDQISIDRRDSEFLQAQYRARARNLRNNAGSAIGGGLLSALGTTSSAGLSIAQLGS